MPLQDKGQALIECFPGHMLLEPTADVQPTRLATVAGPSSWVKTHRQDDRITRLTPVFRGRRPEQVRSAHAMPNATLPSWPCPVNRACASRMEQYLEWRRRDAARCTPS